MKHINEYSEFKNIKAVKESVNEAKLSAIHKAAKKGSYPAVIVVVQNGKVIHQEPVSTPDVAPATFNVMQEKYPKAIIHLEDNTGKRLFSESVVTENYEVIYSDGVSAMKKFRNEKQALDFMKKTIASNKKLRNIAVYKPGMYSTTQTELVVKFWGDGSYLDNVSKKDPKLAAKKLEESVTDAYNNLEKIFGTDQETMDMFQGIEDKGTVKDMIEFIDEFGNEEMLSRYGIRSTAQVKKLAKTIMNEATDVNDPVLIAFRATRRELPKFKPAKAKSRRLSFDKYMDLLDDQRYIEQELRDLTDEMAQTLRDMEQEAEPEGGEIADKYGTTMMKQEKEYAKLKAKKDKIMARIENHRMA